MITIVINPSGTPQVVPLRKAILLYQYHTHCELSTPTPEEPEKVSPPVKDTKAKSKESYHRLAKDPEWRARRNQRHKEQYARMKVERPEKYQEIITKTRERRDRERKERRLREAGIPCP